MYYKYETKFGPRLLKDGGAEFRIWAPGAKKVELKLNGNKNGTKELNPTEHGWFELTVPEAKNGSRYQFVMDGELAVPDPASRFQPEGVHGPSQLVNPLAFKWDDEDWQGRPWNEAVIYELHPGTFSPEGNYQGIIEKLPYLDLLGITAIELLPLADFPGEFNWGYDGVLPYSPARCYGSPEDLKELVNEAHKRGLMVFLDVVYNHFGPDGNYMYVYAQNFFNAQNQTPWGNSINYDGKFSEYVRQFAIDNVLYWLTEFRFDGLRFDAIDSIIDNSDKHLLTEISEAVRNGPGKDRHIHLILENVSNNANFLGTTIGEAGLYDSQWSDDIHHACHVLVTGEDTGYYKDFNADTSNMSALEHLGRSLAEGYSFQGQHSTYWGEKKRGTPSAHLPPTAFIAFTQNHDQVGNRAFGERITSLAEEEAVRAIVGIILLSPTIPMLFMGEEWGSRSNFCWFADFNTDLAESVREGRLREFGKFEQFQDEALKSKIPDPCSEKTFIESRLNWGDLETPEHQKWFGFYKLLLELRKRSIMPIIGDIETGKASWKILEEGLLKVVWPLKSGGALRLIANLNDQGNPAPLFTESEFKEENILFQTPANASREINMGSALPWSVIWFVDR